MVRPGIVLYGVMPSPDIDLKTTPLLSLKSRLIFLKEIERGGVVSYGREYIAKRNTLIGTVAVGYADGYPWRLSGSSKVIIKDDFFPLAGRVCMDHIMVDLKKRQDIKIGEEVVLMGSKKGLKITAEDLAQWANTIPYEIITRLSPDIPRLYNQSLSKHSFQCGFGS
jgi:alanine racemase